MSAVDEVHSGAVQQADPAPKADHVAFWQTRAFYRYGFLALILIVWEVVGPFISPILFSYPSKIAVAFYDLTISGELPYYAMESLQILFAGLFFAIIVGVPLAVV